jgi:hypothetical protein
MIESAPPYRGEGPHALWHVSEDASLSHFEPHHAPEHARDEPLVWAIDTRHLPLYWFPRECPRATFWAVSSTTPADIDTFLGGDRLRRVHIVEPGWLDRMRTTRVVAYRMPDGTFERWDRFWISHGPVVAVEQVDLGDLVELHARARIELSTEKELLTLWERVIASTLDFSGIRLRNATLAS